MAFTVKPLEWIEDIPLGERTRRRYVAHTIFGSISVVRDMGGDWTYQWCFDEKYDEGKVRCDSLVDAQTRAEEFYLNRLLPALEIAHSDE